MDWYTALLVTGRVDNDNPAWSYQDRVEDPLTGYEFGIDPFDTIHGWWTLTGPRVQGWADDDGQIRIERLGRAEHAEAVAVRQAQVREHDARARRGQRRDGLLMVARLDHDMAARLERVAEHDAQRVLVLDDQDGQVRAGHADSGGHRRWYRLEPDTA